MFCEQKLVFAVKTTQNHRNSSKNNTFLSKTIDNNISKCYNSIVKECGFMFFYEKNAKKEKITYINKKESLNNGNRIRNQKTDLRHW